MPQELSTSSCSAAGERTSRGKAARTLASLPCATTVIPAIPFAISSTVSGFAATATFTSKPIDSACLRIAVAIFFGGPKSFSSPARSSVIAPAAVDSTRGENCCAHSIKADCARCSPSGERFCRIKQLIWSASALLMPAITPAPAAGGLQAITRIQLSGPSSTATGALLFRRTVPSSVRMTASTMKNGANRQANSTRGSVKQ